MQSGVFMLLKAFAAFYLSLYRQYTWQPVWLMSDTPEDYHFHRRRFTQKYRNKQKIVRSLWFSMSLLVLAFPVMPFAVFVTLFTTFLSFCILDETQ